MTRAPAPSRRGSPGRLRTSGYAAASPTGSSPLASDWDLLHLTLAGCLLSYIWRIHDVYPVLTTIRFPVLVSAIAIIATLLSSRTLSALPRLRHRMILLMGIIFAIMVASVPGSLYPGRSFSFIVEDFGKTLLLTLMLVVAVRSSRDVERLLAVVVAGAAVYSTHILLRFDVGPNARLADLLYYDANDLAMLLVCTIPLALYFARPGTSWPLRTASLVVVGILLATLVNTGSRGGFLGLLAVSGYLLVSFRAYPLRLRLGALGLVFGFLTLFASDSYWELMRTLLEPKSDYNWAGNARTGRVEVWKRGIGYMMANPLLGVGASAFPVAEGHISELAELQQRGIGVKWSAAHNSFVQIGAELGVVALACFVGLLVAAWRELGKVLAGGGRGTDSSMVAMANAVRASLIGYCAAGFFLSQAYSVYLYSILAITVCLATLPGAHVPAAGVSALQRRRRGRGHGSLQGWRGPSQQPAFPRG